MDSNCHFIMRRHDVAVDRCVPIGDNIGQWPMNLKLISANKNNYTNNVLNVGDRA